MTFKAAQWSLRLYIRPRKDRVMREIFGVGCEEPHCGVCSEHPVPPALGVAEFRLEGPAIGADVDQFRWVILACRGLHEEADTQEGLLLPFCKLWRLHRRPALEVDREAKEAIAQARTVHAFFPADYKPLERTYGVRQADQDIGGPPVEA